MPDHQINEVGVSYHLRARNNIFWLDPTRGHIGAKHIDLTSLHCCFHKRRRSRAFARTDDSIFDQQNCIARVHMRHACLQRIALEWGFVDCV